MRWCDIPGYEGLYKISDHGDILNVKTNKIRKLKPSKNGYVNVDLYKNTEVSWKRVHRLVAMCFVDNPNNYDIVMHLDNNKSNNVYTNLKWGTISENTKQAFEDGLISTSKTFYLYNEYLIITCDGLNEVCSLTGYSKSTISTYLNTGEELRRGKYEGFKVKRG